MSGLGDSKIDRRLASRAAGMSTNAIWDVLKDAKAPGVISLAGGIPALESFPIEKLNQTFERVMEKYGPAVLQYDVTEGFAPLRSAIADEVKERGVAVAADDVLVYSGSQSTLDICGKMLISKGDKVACVDPTYLGALSAFAPYEPDIIRLDTDEGGLIPESLEQALEQHDIKLIYLIPTFQNPTGRTLSLERRKTVAELITRYDALLYEDDPYSQLRYRGERLPTIWSFAPERVIYASTFSKILMPGLRTGFAIAPEWLRPWLIIAKQGVDLHTSTLNQALIAEFITSGDLETQIAEIVELYKPRQEALLGALRASFPQNFKWQSPDGGMFVWVDGPQGFDAKALYREVIAKKVAFMPGSFFYAKEGDGLNTIRLNFTTQNVADIERAVSILSDCLKASI